MIFHGNRILFIGAHPDDIELGAGALIRSDVPDYALMLGVPAIQKGWMSRHGSHLKSRDKNGIMYCSESGWRYREIEPGLLRCLDWPEDSPLSN